MLQAIYYPHFAKSIVRWIAFITGLSGRPKSHTYVDQLINCSHIKKILIPERTRMWSCTQEYEKQPYSKKTIGVLLVQLLWKWTRQNKLFHYDFTEEVLYDETGEKVLRFFLRIQQRLFFQSNSTQSSTYLKYANRKLRTHFYYVSL